jgi:hypothetical protein
MRAVLKALDKPSTNSHPKKDLFTKHYNSIKSETVLLLVAVFEPGSILADI